MPSIYLTLRCMLYQQCSGWFYFNFNFKEAAQLVKVYLRDFVCLSVYYLPSSFQGLAKIWVLQLKGAHNHLYSNCFVFNRILIDYFFIIDFFSSNTLTEVWFKVTLTNPIFLTGFTFYHSYLSQCLPFLFPYYQT